MKNKKVRAFLFLLCYNRKLIGDNMEKIEVKEIGVNKDRKLRYYNDNSLLGTVSFSEDFLNTGVDYRLHRSGDYTFTTYNFNNEDLHDREISFTFDINHPYYMPFLHLLNGDDELIIDDDDTREDMLKYMKIAKENDIITLSFVNNKEDMLHDTVSDKYRVFIKSITRDGSSKLDRDLDNDVKKRLSKFFRELDGVFASEYHQVTIEEYMLRKEIMERKINNVLEYYLAMTTLDEIPRTGWLNWHVDRDRIESVGEHTTDTQQLAWAMWSEFDIDVNIERVIAMLSIHETEEPVIGDIPLVHDLKKYKKEMGAIAVNEMTSGLAKKKYLRDLVSEFEKQETPEAVFAHFCDKMVCDIKSKYYDEDSVIDLSNQDDNPSSKVELVKSLLKEFESFSAMWMRFGRYIYGYPEEFDLLSRYAEHSNLHEIRDNKLNKAKVKVNEFVSSKE